MQPLRGPGVRQPAGEAQPLYLDGCHRGLPALPASQPSDPEQSEAALVTILELEEAVRNAKVHAPAMTESLPLEKRPEFVREASQKFGAQCIVVAIDAKQVGDNHWEIFTHGGRKPTGINAVEWAVKMADYGAGEILLTSMDRDGVKSGFDLGVTKAISAAVNIPVIASGGVGNLDHLVDGVKLGGADAVLAASIFHFGEYTVQQAKEHMAAAGIEMRL